MMRRAVAVVCALALYGTAAAQLELGLSPVYVKYFGMEGLPIVGSARAKLLTEVYDDGTWRYRRPAQRDPSEREHLRGFDITRTGRFAWPKP